MKRYIKWLINWFVCWFGRMELSEKVCFVLALLCAIITVRMSFLSFYKPPASSFDYDTLELQAISAQKSPEQLFRTDCDINVNGKIITVTFENDSCWVTAKYNNQFELLSTKKKDKGFSWLSALASSLFLGFLTYGYTFLILTFLSVYIKPEKR